MAEPNIGVATSTSASWTRPRTTSRPQTTPSTIAPVSKIRGEDGFLFSGGGGKSAEASADDASSTVAASSPDTMGPLFPPLVGRLEQQEGVSNDEAGGCRGLPPTAEEAAADDSAGGERDPDDLREDNSDTVTIVARFDSRPAEYRAPYGSVRLHVRPGCLRPGQAAGPVTLKTAPGCLVECEGRSYLVCAVVDCQPCGATFDALLDLDFRIGGELNEQVTRTDGGSDVFECFARLRDAYKVRKSGSLAYDLQLSAAGEEEQRV